MIVFILFSLISCLAMGAELKTAKLISVIEDKSITPARAFSTQNVYSIVKCVYLCLSNNSCMSVSYKHNGECKLCNRGWNSFCTICEDDPGAAIYSKETNDRCQNGGLADRNNECVCHDGYVGTNCEQIMTGCEEGSIQSYYSRSSGIIYIKPASAPSPFPVYCSFKEIRARTYIQRHYGTGLEFNQTWIRYRDGFGDMFSTAEQFWLGNQYLHYITTSGFYTLVIEMGIKDRNEIRQQEYAGFYVTDEAALFEFTLEYAPSTTLSGLPSLGDCMSYVDRGIFSTFDNDNDGRGFYGCANVHGSGWWFGYSPYTCGYCNPNGVLVQSKDGRRTGVDNEVFWTTDMTDWSPWYTEMWLELR